MKPSIPDPSVNTVECVTEGHEKAPAFPGTKQLLHGVCWCFLCVAVVFSVIVSKWLTVWLREWQKDEVSKSKVAATIVMSVLISFGELGLIIYGWTQENISYLKCYFSCFVIGCFVLILRNCCHRCCTIDPHDWRCIFDGSVLDVLYLGMFIVCHHLLWIILGIITEPYWAVTVLAVVTSLFAIIIFLIYELHATLASVSCNSFAGAFVVVMTVVTCIFCSAACVLLTVVLLVVAQAFVSESLIAAIVQGGFMLLLPMCIGWYLKLGRSITGENRTTDNSLLPTHHDSPSSSSSKGPHKISKLPNARTRRKRSKLRNICNCVLT